MNALTEGYPNLLPFSIQRKLIHRNWKQQNDPVQKHLYRKRRSFIRNEVHEGFKKEGCCKMLQDKTTKKHEGIHGRYYPLEVDENPQLTPVDKRVWWVVDMRDCDKRHCFASNAWIAMRAKTTVKVASASISKLGYLAMVKAPDYRGMGRVIKVDPNFYAKYAALREAYNKLWSSKNNLDEQTPSSMKKIPLMQMRRTPLVNTGTDKDMNINTRLKRRKIPTESTAKAVDAAILSLPCNIQDVFTCWKKHGLHLPGTETKAWGRSVDLINGLFTGAAFSDVPEMKEHKHPYTIVEIKLSIGRFAQAVHDPNVLPVKKSLIKGMPPNEFILNSYCRPSMKRSETVRSNFIHYLHNGPLPTIKEAELDQDDHPELTKALMHQYRNLVQGGLKTNFDVKNRNKFILAAKKLHAFVDAFRNRFNSFYNLTPHNLSETLIESIVEDMEGVTEKISPGYLCSDETFNRRFPNHLYQRSIINQDVQGQPWRYAVGTFSTPREKWTELQQPQ